MGCSWASAPPPASRWMPGKRPGSTESGSAGATIDVIAGQRRAHLRVPSGSGPRSLGCTALRRNSASASETRNSVQMSRGS